MRLLAGLVIFVVVVLVFVSIYSMRASPSPYEEWRDGDSMYLISWSIRSDELKEFDEFTFVTSKGDYVFEGRLMKSYIPTNTTVTLQWRYRVYPGKKIVKTGLFRVVPA